jgi:hypothetical protein
VGTPGKYGTGLGGSTGLNFLGKSGFEVLGRCGIIQDDGPVVVRFGDSFFGGRHGFALDLRAFGRGVRLSPSMAFSSGIHNPSRNWTYSRKVITSYVAHEDLVPRRKAEVGFASLDRAAPLFFCRDRPKVSESEILRQCLGIAFRTLAVFGNAKLKRPLATSPSTAP